MRLAAVVPAAASTAASTSAYDPAVVRVRLARADEWSLQGRSYAARKEYRAVAEMQRANNVLPTEALWRLASEHNIDRAWKQTAAVLHELANDAERFGNPQVQAQALLEATILYDKAGMPQEAHVCATRVNLLMASPHISEEFRQEVQRRIIRK